MSSLENRGNGSWRLTISDLLTLYGLRHTAASLMIAEGLPIRDVAARLGHSQTSTTLDIYAHALIDSNSRATDAISRALEEARKA